MDFETNTVMEKSEHYLRFIREAYPADFDYGFNLAYGADYFRDDDLLRDLRGLLDDETRRHIEL